MNSSNKSKPNVYKFKYAQFKPSFTNKQRFIYVRKNQQTILESPIWQIRDKYNTQYWKQIFYHLQFSLATKLYLVNSNNPNVLKQIAQCKFPNLKQLYLTGNQIVSIEIINSIQIPKIRRLGLPINDVSNIKPLLKSYFNELDQIIMTQNKFNQINNLNRFKINKLTSQFVIKLITNYSSHIQFNKKVKRVQSINQWAKMQSFCRHQNISQNFNHYNYSYRKKYIIQTKGFKAMFQKFRF